MTRIRLLLPLVLLGACTPAAIIPAPQRTSLPGLNAITEADLRRDLFAMASDSMRGRMGATSDELRASVWLAERAREAGMEPAGDDGTFFQFFPVRRVRVASNSQVSVGGSPLRLWEDAFVVTPVDARLDAPLVWANGTTDVRGKAVVATLAPPRTLPPRWVSLWAYRYTLAAIREQAAALSRRGAAAVVLVADSISATQFPLLGMCSRTVASCWTPSARSSAPAPVCRCSGCVGRWRSGCALRGSGWSWTCAAKASCTHR